jgi:hypothetical protein
MLGAVPRIGDGDRLFKIGREAEEAGLQLEFVQGGKAALEARAIGILVARNGRDISDRRRRSLLVLFENRRGRIRGGRGGAVAVRVLLMEDRTVRVRRRSGRGSAGRGVV